MKVYFKKNKQTLSVQACRHSVCHYHPNQYIESFHQDIEKRSFVPLPNQTLLCKHILIFITSFNLSPLFLREGYSLRVLFVIITKRHVEIISTKKKGFDFCKDIEKWKTKTKKVSILTRKYWTDIKLMSFLWNPSEFTEQIV